jgi:replicative DNA helicase
MTTTKPIPVPSDLMAEQCLLCGMMLDPSTIPAVCAHAGGVPDFYSEANRTIFEVIRDLHESGADADGAAVVTALNAEGTLAAVGGHDYLERVLDSTSSGVNWPHYLKLITDAGRRRELLNTCEAVLYGLRTNAGLEQCLTKAIRGLERASINRGAPKDIHVRDAASEVIAGLEAGKPTVFPTGLTIFDQTFGGIPAQGVTTFLGVPGSGKSSLAAGIALRLARAGIGVRVFSFEMSGFSVTANLLASESLVCVNEALRTGRKPEAVEMYRVAEAADSVHNLNLAFVDELLSARQIEDRAALYAAQGVRCIVVDYIQNLPPSEPGQADVARIEEACRVMQRIARRHVMCVLMVSQMFGAAAREDRPPQKSDGMGSAAIDQVSDCTIGVYRPVVFTPRTQDETAEQWDARKRQAQLHVLKNKKGPCGGVDVVFEGRWTKFMDQDVGFG